MRNIREVTRETSILVSGNCQIDSVIQALAVLYPTASVKGLREENVESTSLVDVGCAMLDSASHWIGMLPSSRLQARLRDHARARGIASFELNPIVFRGFHPDSVYAFTDAGVLQRPGPYHSAILLWSYRHGLSLPHALRLFNDDVFRKLGYFQAFHDEVDTLHGVFNEAGLDARRIWRCLRRQAPFMHTINHPTGAALAAVTTAISDAIGLPRVEETDATFVLWDRLTEHSWPIYPEIAAFLGVPGGYAFRFWMDYYPTLESFATSAWSVYEGLDATNITFERMEDRHFNATLEAAA